MPARPNARLPSRGFRRRRTTCFRRHQGPARGAGVSVGVGVGVCGAAGSRALGNVLVLAFRAGGDRALFLAPTLGRCEPGVLPGRGGDDFSKKNCSGPLGVGSGAVT